jgi:hypothetical protein
MSRRPSRPNYSHQRKITEPGQTPIPIRGKSKPRQSLLQLIGGGTATRKQSAGCPQESVDDQVRIFLDTFKSAKASVTPVAAVTATKRQPTPMPGGQPRATAHPQAATPLASHSSQTVFVEAAQHEPPLDQHDHDIVEAIQWDETSRAQFLSASARLDGIYSANNSDEAQEQLCEEIRTWGEFLRPFANMIYMLQDDIELDSLAIAENRTPCALSRLLENRDAYANKMTTEEIILALLSFSDKQAHYNQLINEVMIRKGNLEDGLLFEHASLAVPRMKNMP